jgi:alginate O-acetyltransferase complex protein AlgJ
MNKNALPLSAIFMIAFLMLCFGLAVSTIVLKQPKLKPELSGIQNIMNGKIAASFEKKFEENLILRYQIVGMWGAVQYGIFKSGGKNVVVGKDGWLFTTEEFETHKDAAKAEARLLSLAQKINDHLKSHGIELIIALVPAKARIYPEYLGRHQMPDSRDSIYPRMLNAFQSMGIPTPDIAGNFLEHKDGAPLYLKLDTHWTPQGAMMAANMIAKYVQGMGSRKNGFKFEKTEEITIEGDLEKYIKTGIFSSIFAPPQEKITKTIEEKSGNDTGSGLFGDEDIPVALIGTSYSAIDKWNFEGALKYALQLDVLNMADEGQGPLEPMAKFMNETDLKNTKIKYVIWEIPERFVPVSYKDIKFPAFIEGGQ